MLKKKSEKNLFILVIDKNILSELLINIFRRTLINFNTRVITSNFNIYIKRKKLNIYALFNFQKKIIEAKNLKKIKYPINFHPGTKNFPGRGVVSWALYKNSKNYGATAHIMNAKVDTGKIIEEKTFKINNYDNIESLKFKSFLTSIELFYDILLQFSKNKKIKFSKKKWTRRPYKINELDKINLIKKGMSKKQIKNILKSTIYYPFGPYKLIKNKRVKLKVKKYINIL